MITNDSDYEPDDVPSGLLEGLEQLALALDAERYPGPAWPPVPVPAPQPRGRRTAGWKMTASIAAAAGIALAALAFRPAPTPPAALPSATLSPGAVAAEYPPAATPIPDKVPREQQTPAVERVAVAQDAPSPSEQAISGDEVAESSSPQVVVVEDLDSYSLIDISGDAPVVSYMTKDASSMEYPVPVPLGPQLPPGAFADML